MGAGVKRVRKPLTEEQKRKRREANARYKAAHPAEAKRTQKASQKKWNARNPHLVKKNKRRATVKALYGITLEEYERLKAQAGYCPICGTELIEGNCNGNAKSLHHCHKTGKVVGFVCSNCNMGMGKFGDDPVLLEKAAAWLRATMPTDEQRSLFE